MFLEIVEEDFHHSCLAGQNQWCFVKCTYTYTSSIYIVSVTFPANIQLALYIHGSDDADIRTGSIVYLEGESKNYRWVSMGKACKGERAVSA